VVSADVVPAEAVPTATAFADDTCRTAA
jgi:hypothetical protein